MSNNNLSYNSIECKIKENNKFYIPICREKECGGIIKISIDENNFLINATCYKNKNHINKNLSFDIFEKYYLKEKFTQNCSTCFCCLDDKDKYECIKCQKLYCSSCFILDTHIKKNLKNLKIITNKCSKDKNQLIYYCINCCQNVCPFCLTQYTELEKKPHKNHYIENILDLIPSTYEINSLKEKILKKSNAFDSLIKSLDDWLIELTNKIQKIKQNLKNEINILKKLYFNFNCNYVDYAYYSNFKIHDSIIDYNNKYLKRFMESQTFLKKSKCLFDLLNKEQKIQKEKVELEKIFDIGDSNILKIFTDEFLLCTHYKQKCLQLLDYDEDDNDFTIENSMKFNNKISYLSFSTDKSRIYACLKDEKKIIIINYNSNDNILELNEEKIEINSNGNFNKCIYFNNNCLIAIDNYNIYLFDKKDTNLNKYLNEKKKNLIENIYDICKIDDNYLIFSQKNRVTFLTFENLIEDKVIPNIDCVESCDSLIKIKDYILVNCKKGIAMISIKNQEFIQYFEWPNKIAVKVFKDYIYIFDANNEFYEYIFLENNLKPILKTKIINNDNENEKLIADNIFINDDDYKFIWGKSLYKFKNEDV